MNKEIMEQTDSLESIITELTKLNELIYTGYSIDSMSRFVTEDNVMEIGKYLQEIVLRNDGGNIRLHLVVS
jgi:hypothetical protein